VNWIDVLLLLVVAFSVLSGLMAGFARVGIGFIAALVGIFFGFWCYGIAGAYVLDYVSSKAVANLIGFFVIFTFILLLGAIVGRMLAKFFRWAGLSWLDRLLGGAFGVVRGLIISVALVTVLLAFAPSPPPRSVLDSEFIPYLVGPSDFFAALTPHEIKDAFRDARDKAEKVWHEHSRRHEAEGLRRE
jgi:membrane protein required for colicin V production